MAKSPPADWSFDRRTKYVDWAEAVGVGLKGINPWIETLFDTALLRVRKAIRQHEISIKAER